MRLVAGLLLLHLVGEQVALDGLDVGQLFRHLADELVVNLLVAGDDCTSGQSTATT